MNSKERRSPFNFRYPLIMSAAAIAGIAAGTYLELWAALTVMLFASLLFLLYVLFFKANKAAVVLFVIIGVVFCLYSDALLRRAEEKSAVYGGFSGEITDCRDGGDNTCRMTVRCSVTGTEETVSLNVRNCRYGLYRCGDYIYVDAVLSPLKCKENEYSFDSRNYYLSQGAFYTAYAQADQISVLGHNDSVISVFWNARETINANLHSALPEEDASLISAMLLGMDEGLAQEAADSFRDIGVAHIFSVSGLHVGIIVAALNTFLMLCWVGRKARFAVITVFMAAYCALTAFSPSIVRASLMTFIMLLAGVFKRRYDPLCALGAAALVILAVNPYSLYSAGFQLSFMACIGIIAFGNILKVKNKAANYFVSAVNVTLAAQLPCLPVMAGTFGSISVIAPVANIFIVPFASAALVMALPLSIIALIIPSASVLMSVLKVFTFVIYRITELFASMPFNAVSVSAASAAVTICYYALLVFSSRYYAVKIKTKLITCATAAVLLVCSWAGGILFTRDNAHVVFLSVGSGDCTVVSVQDDYYVIDTGPGDYAKAGMSNRGYRELERYLKGRGVGEISVILTHGDADHSGGLMCILRSGDIKIRRIFYNPVTIQSDTVREELDNSGCLSEVWSGDRLNTDSGLCFDFLYPLTDSGEGRNVSVAFIMSYGGCRLLFCGDNQTQDGDVISQMNVGCDIMLLPHHGSKDTRSEKLLESATPSTVIVSSADEASAPPGAFVTAVSGQITIDITKDGRYTVKEYRDEQR